jgi:hypothetical protein
MAGAPSQQTEYCSSPTEAAGLWNVESTRMPCCGDPMRHPLVGSPGPLWPVIAERHRCRTFVVCLVLITTSVVLMRAELGGAPRSARNSAR